MFEVKVYDLDFAQENTWSRVIVVSRYNGKWVYCKKKEKETWEIPGGHIEPGEDWLTAAKRELYEETGAVESDIKPVCLYSVSTFGLLCFAEIRKFDKLPENFEMKEIGFFDEEPETLSYPGIHPLLFKTVKEKLAL